MRVHVCETGKKVLSVAINDLDILWNCEFCTRCDANYAVIGHEHRVISEDNLRAHRQY
jgi:hypothetical protein